MSEISRRLIDNLAQVRERIAAAAARSGRNSAEVTLIGVTKYVTADIARALFEAGLSDLGESRPQELWRKAEALADLPIRWHLIGHLQRNKAHRTLPLVSLIHSGDSLRLLEALDAESAAISQRTDVLLEVNISGDAAKHGFPPGELATLLPAIGVLTHLRVRGLMGMAGLEGDEERARREFAALRQMRERLRAEAPPGMDLSELSMGMSGDYEAAIQEGATLVRVGSALFEGLPT